MLRTAKQSNNPIEKEKANRELESLYNEYEKAMMEGIQAHAPFKSITTQCIQCGAILTGAEAEKYSARKIACPKCGYTGGIVRNPKGDW